MKGWSGRLFAATLVLVTLFAAGCSAGDDGPPPAEVAQQEETTSSVLADGKIVVASNVAYPPFEFAPRQGPKGFDIDLMNEVADRAGLEVRYRNVQFDSLLRGLSSELFDAVISGMTITDTRRQQVDFSDPYYNVDEALVVRSGSEIESTGDLAEETLGVQLGTMGQAEAGELLNAGDVEAVRPYRTIEAAFVALEKGVVGRRNLRPAGSPDGGGRVGWRAGARRGRPDRRAVRHSLTQGEPPGRALQRGARRDKRGRNLRGDLRGVDRPPPGGDTIESPPARSGFAYAVSTAPLAPFSTLRPRGSALSTLRPCDLAFSISAFGHAEPVPAAQHTMVHMPCSVCLQTAC